MAEEKKDLTIAALSDMLHIRTDFGAESVETERTAQRSFGPRRRDHRRESALTGYFLAPKAHRCSDVRT